jgi:hypothetical protein
MTAMTALMSVLYEIAVMTLQRDELAGTVQIHWGVSDRQVFRSWHRKEDVIDIEKEPADA